MKRPARRHARTQKLPSVIDAAIVTIREQLALQRQHARHEREYWLRIGEAWYTIKSDPELDETGGIVALGPILPLTPQFLNRCAIAYDGQVTGDLDRGELWVKHTRYPLGNDYEPYKMAEIVEAYRNRLRSRPTSRIPLAMTAGRLFARSGAVSFGDLGSGMLGDCHRLLTEVPDGIIDHVIVDPTFGLVGAPGGGGKTTHEWDRPLDWDRLWPEIWRVLNPAGNVVITSMEPLTSALVQSQLGFFLFKEYWLRKATNIMGPRNRRPLNLVEEVPIFSRGGTNERTYNPQMVPLENSIDRLLPRYGTFFKDSAIGRNRQRVHARQPGNIIVVRRTDYDRPIIMHCQKPVELMRYLIRTYTNPGNLVLDFCAGSFTTAIACFLEKRKFIGIENYRNHFVLGTRRVQSLMNPQSMPKVAADWPSSL